MPKLNLTPDASQYGGEPLFQPFGSQLSDELPPGLDCASLHSNVVIIASLSEGRVLPVTERHSELSWHAGPQNTPMAASKKTGLGTYPLGDIVFLGLAGLLQDGAAGAPVGVPATDTEDADAAACDAEITIAVLMGQSFAVGWIVYCDQVSIRQQHFLRCVRNIYITIKTRRTVDCGSQETNIRPATIAIINIWAPLLVIIDHCSTSRESI